MKRGWMLFVWILVILSVTYSFTGQCAVAETVNTSTKEEIFQKVKKLHMPFVANEGQADEGVAYYAKTFVGTVFVTKEGKIVYSLPKFDEVAKEGGNCRKFEDGGDIAERDKGAVGNGSVLSCLYDTGNITSLDMIYALIQSRSVSREYVARVACPPPDTGHKGSVLRIFDDWHMSPSGDSSYLSIIDGSRRLLSVQATTRNPKSLCVVLKEELIGANVSRITGEGESVTKVNYFKGSDPSKWKSDISAYEYANLGEVYDEIELKLKAHGNNVEKLFTVKPGADPNQIKISLSGVQQAESSFDMDKQLPESPIEKGARGLSVNEQGELVVETELGAVKFTKPIAYQVIDGKRVYVECGYVIAKCEGISPRNTQKDTKLKLLDTFLRFRGLSEISDTNYEFQNPYCADSVIASGVKQSPLVNFQAGSGLQPEPLNLLYTGACAVDTILKGINNEVQVTNLNPQGSPDTDNGTTLPCTPLVRGESRGTVTDGGHDSRYIYGFRVASYDKTKDLIIDPLLASTLLGEGYTDIGQSLTVAPDGSIYVIGSTNTTNFPTTENAYDTTSNNSSSIYWDVFVSRLSGDLTTMLASTYFGGTASEYGYSVALDKDGNVYVAGVTYSANFPTTYGAYDTIYGGGNQYDGFISKFNANLTQLLTSTYLGGAGADYVHAIVIDKDRNIYASGSTSSQNGGFPTTSGAYDTTPNGQDDAFISKLNGDLTTLLASTYLGGSSYEYFGSNFNSYRPEIGNALAIDNNGNICITGQTLSTNFPTTDGSYAPSHNSYNNTDGFVSKLSSDLSTLIASTYLGGDGYDYCYAIATGSNGDIYVTGNTLSLNFPSTEGAYDTSPSNAGGGDIYVSKFNDGLTSLLASTFLGPGKGRSMTIDKGGNVCITGVTNSSLYFPTTPCSYNPYIAGGGIIVSKFSGELTALIASTYLARGDGRSIAIDKDGNVCITGATDSATKDFPTTPGAYDTANSGYSSFVSKFDPAFLSVPVPSTIKIDNLASSIYFGASLGFYVRVTPIRATQVNVTITKDGVEPDTLTGTTTTNGYIYLTGYIPQEAGTWTAAASSEGNCYYNPAKGEPYTVTVNKIKPNSITIQVSPYTIHVNQTVDITGNVYLAPYYLLSRDKFLEGRLKLIRKDPEGEYEDVIETQPYLDGSVIKYKFAGVSLPVIGKWEMKVVFEEDVNFTAGSSNLAFVNVTDVVKDVAGYAIIVEGRVEGDSGLDAHNLTTNFVYRKLLERGFTAENVSYFNFKGSQNGVDATPTKSGTLNAITTWAVTKMNNAPAPLYIILVGHGKKDEFPVFPGSIKASDLSGALDDLESQLNENALEEDRVVVIGASRSGSFINNLSKPNTRRTIITGCDTEEVSYKGPLSPDETLRQGDYFVYELFSYAARGLNLKRSYELAAGKIAQYTENENGNGLNEGSAGNGRYFDKAAQHPQFDDNGDGIGTYGQLSSLSNRDGGRAFIQILGKGTPPVLLDIIRVTDIVSLEANDPALTLFAQVNDVSKVDEVWIEIASPGHGLDNNRDISEQQVVDLPRFSNNAYNESEKKYLWDDFNGNNQFNNFQSPGTYGIFYFAKDTDQEIVPLMESEVVRNKAGNKPPGAFSFVSPADGAETPIALIFDWEDSKDKEKKGITYTLMIAENSSFDPVYYEQKGLTDSIAAVDKTAKLRDGVTYYWRVLAIDSDGGVSYIGTSTQNPQKKKTIEKSGEDDAHTFTPKVSGSYPGFVKGYVYSMKTDKKISKATVAIEGVEGAFTTGEDGAYLFQMPSGTYMMGAEAIKYLSANKEVGVDALKATTENIGLTSESRVLGTVIDKETKGKLEGVEVSMKNQTATRTAVSNNKGKYGIKGLEKGTYELSAKKDGYKDYTKTVKLRTGQKKKLMIKLEKIS